MRAEFESLKHNVAIVGGSHQSIGRRTFTHTLAGVLLFLSAGWANATVFLDEHFDSYVDQAAFQASWNITGTAAVTLSTDQSVSPAQSVEGLTTATRSGKSFGEIGTLTGTSDVVVFRVNFYDSAGTASAYRQYAELIDGAASATGQLFALGLNNNIASTKYMARALGFDGGNGVSAFFQLNGAGSPSRSTGWHTLEADIGDNNVNYYVDGILSKTLDISAGTDRSFDTARVGSNLSSTQVAYFDDVHVERMAVPEPSAVALCLLGGLGLAIGAISRRRKA